MIKNNISRSLLPMIAIAIILSAMIFTFAHANPLQYTSGAQTALATTSPAYMTPGNATSTLVYDSYQVNGTNQADIGNNYANNRSELLLQFTASSTLSVLSVNEEYSQDGIDWYQDAATNLSDYATSTLPIVLGGVPSYQWTFASSTAGGIGIATNNRATRAISITVPTRYVRFVFTCAIGGAGCGVWAQVVPAKEDPQS